MCVLPFLFIQLRLARIGHGSCCLFSPILHHPKSYPQHAIPRLDGILPSWWGSPAYQEAKKQQTRKETPPQPHIAPWRRPPPPWGVSVILSKTNFGLSIKGVAWCNSDFKSLLCRTGVRSQTWQRALAWRSCILYSGTGVSRDTTRAGFVWEVCPDLTPPPSTGLLPS